MVAHSGSVVCLKRSEFQLNLGGAGANNTGGIGIFNLGGQIQCHADPVSCISVCTVCVDDDVLSTRLPTPLPIDDGVLSTRPPTPLPMAKTQWEAKKNGFHSVFEKMVVVGIGMIFPILVRWVYLRRRMRRSCFCLPPDAENECTQRWISLFFRTRWPGAFRILEEEEQERDFLEHEQGTLELVTLHDTGSERLPPGVNIQLPERVALRPEEPSELSDTRVNDVSLPLSVIDASLAPIFAISRDMRIVAWSPGACFLSRSHALFRSTDE